MAKRPSLRVPDPAGDYEPCPTPDILDKGCGTPVCLIHGRADVPLLLPEFDIDSVVYNAVLGCGRVHRRLLWLGSWHYRVSFEQYGPRWAGTFGDVQVTATPQLGADLSQVQDPPPPRR